MAEVAIVSVTIATLSFLVAARNGLETVGKDVDRFKHQHAQLSSLTADLDIAISNIDLWSRLWRINNKTPADFPEMVWGPEGYRVIYSLLRTIRRQARTARQKIEAAFSVDDYKGKNSLVDNRKSLDGSCDPSAYMSFRQKLTNTLFRGNIVQDHVKRLNEDVTRLELLSKLKVRQQHGLKIPVDSATDLQKWIVDFFDRSFLFSLQQESRPYSQALYQASLCDSIESSELALKGLVQLATHTELQLGPPEDMPSIVYDLVTQLQNMTPHGSAIRFVIMAIKKHAEDPTCRAARQYGFLKTHAVSPCNCSLGDCKQYFWLRAEGQDPDQCHFHNSSSHQVQERCHSFPSLWRETSSLFPTELHGHFVRTERLELAYHLAVFTFIMFRTSWTSEVCSCMLVYRYHAHRRHYRVRTKMGANHYTPSSANHDPTCHQWCQQSFKNMPITRLGLLLIEIAIAQPICHARWNHLAGGVEVRPHDEPEGDQQTQSLFAAELIGRVERQASADYAAIVTWCLTQPFEPDHMDSNAIEEFYHNVLEP